MMLQLTDKAKIYLYLIILLVLTSAHNHNSINYFSDYFKIKKIELTGDIDDSLKQEILLSLGEFYNHNIFDLSSNEISKTLNNFNIISKYKIKKKYPSEIKIELKKTSILGFFFIDDKKIFIGANGKKITEQKYYTKDLPLIKGKININKFLDLNKVLINNGFKLNDFISFNFFKSNRWDLIHKNKIVIKLPTEELNKNLKILKKIFENENINNLDIIDLRVKNKIILS